ncbi:MAG: M12 family metallo-peptidase [Chloroflexota bacterium]|nr:M12 family metallo-peptidase [Chloroflexota bacterium]
MASFYNEVSNGSLAVTGDVFGWYTLTINLSTCDYNGIATAARAAATADGVVLSNYTNFSYVFPRVSSCGWGGLANVNGVNSWINGTSAMGVYVPSHELGHNFGAHHANALTCTSNGVRVQFSSSCSSAEYADPFDLMGSNASSSNGIRHMHTWHRKQIGVLTTADWQTVTASGTYTVTTAQVHGGVPRIVRVPRPVSGQYYYMEFRQPYGIFDNWAVDSPAVNGVMVRIAPATSRIQSQLIDANPSTSSFSDAPLAVGQKFVDKINEITIITRSISSSGARVYIQVGPDVTAPTAPGTLSATLTTATSVSLSWGAAFDEIGVTGYRVSRDGVLLGTVSGLTFTDNNVPQGGTRRYSVAARDAAGNIGPAVTRDIVVPDTLAPSSPGSISGVVTAPGELSLSWAAATDNVGVTGYRVSVNGTLAATVATPSYNATGLLSGVSYTFSVTAHDAAGNVGPAVSATFVASDVTAPSAPGVPWLVAHDGSSVSLAWSAATDNVGVTGYRLTRDGQLIGTTAGTSYTDSGISGSSTYVYTVAAFDAAGNVGPASSITVNPPTSGGGDATAPTVSAPLMTLLAGQAGSVNVPVIVRWTATDPGGVTSVELQQSKNGGSWTSVAVASPSATSVTLMRPPGSTFAFRLRATDKAGNTSGWAVGPTVRLLARQESSKFVKYAGTWTKVSTTSAYGGALRYAKSSSASTRLTFSGSSIAWLSSRGPKRGIADIYIDGVKVASVDLYAPALQTRAVVFTQSWASAATRTIQVKVRGTSGRPRVDLDAFLVVR